jgi:methyl-accepting chemotaxis protein
MKWFRDLNIGRKLFISFSMTALISVLIGWAGYYGLSNVLSTQDAMFNISFAQLRLLSDMNTALLMARGDIRVAMYTKVDARRQKYLNSAVEQSEKAEKLLVEMEKTPMTRQLKDSVQLLHETWRHYREVREPVLALIRDGKDDEAQAPMDGEISQTMVRSRTLLVSVNKLLNQIVEKQNEEANAASTEATWELLIVLVLGCGLTVGCALFIKHIVSTPIKRGMEMMQELAKGNLQVRMNLDSDDEIGALTRSMDVFADTLQGIVRNMHCIAEGSLAIDVRTLDDKDEIVPALIEIRDSLRALVDESTMLTRAAVDGQLSVRGDVNKFKGGYREIVEGVNATLDKIILPITEGSRVLETMAKGNLTVRMTGDFKGDHQMIKNSINHLGESLDQALSNVVEAVTATASASSEISSSTEEMASGAQEQTQQASEVSGAIDEMTKTIMDTSKNASFAAHTAKGAGDTAKDGGKVMLETIAGMNRIADVVRHSAETVEALGRSSDQIGEIVQVIDDIADQTNLLALNAAIEAARAGEQGRGFAVVADEVRKLAERTTKATKEIALMIRQIQKDTANAVASMKTGTDEVEHGKAMADKAGDSLKEIIAGAEKVVDVATQVAAASEEQSSAAEQIGKNIEAISNVTAESASGTQQIARAAEDLNRLTQNLQDLLTQFTLSGAMHVSASAAVLRRGNGRSWKE